MKNDVGDHLGPYITCCKGRLDSSLTLYPTPKGLGLDLLECCLGGCLMRIRGRGVPCGQGGGCQQHLGRFLHAPTWNGKG